MLQSNHIQNGKMHILFLLFFLLGWVGGGGISPPMTSVNGQSHTDWYECVMPKRGMTK